MRVLRPNSVSTGSTERQFDLSPQSPQPSHTRSLISTRGRRSGERPRLRSRRISAAHAWSWTSTVTPGWRELALRLARSVAVPHTSRIGGSDAAGSVSGPSVVTMIRRTPSARLRVERGHGMPPAGALAAGHRDGRCRASCR